MRSFQVMRYGRRMNPTENQLSRLIDQSSNLTKISGRRSSMFISGDEHRQDSHQYNEDDDSIVLRRNTLAIQKPSVTTDGYDLSRRGSFTNTGRRLSVQQQDVTESSKSKTNLKNFYVFFVLLFLFIFIAVVYSFIRMIKNQVA